jgi:UDP-N-acetylmuramoylalanine--D-glutamate ligase
MQQVLILGCGKSGLAAAKLLAKRKESFLLYADDTNTYERLPQELTKFFVDKNKATSLLAKKEIKKIIISPGIALEHPLVKKAQQLSIATISEIELALEDFGGEILAITGTNGKTTTTLMCQHILKKNALRATCGGNIGTPVSELICQHPHPDILILELSSYQLEQIQKLSCRVSIITNLSPDHLERHKTFTNYTLAKYKLITFTEEESFCEQSFIDPIKSLSLSLKNLHILDFKTTPTPSAAIQKTLLTQVNIKNALFAAHACAKFTNKNVDSLLEQLIDFQLPPHRYQPIASYNKILFINDSKATNIDSLLCALEACPNNTCLLIGGLCKTSNYAPIIKYKNKLSSVLIFGPQASEISASIPQIKTQVFSSLKSILNTLESLTTAADVSTILLSPGGASFDEFTDFNARGEFFINTVKRFIKDHSK